MILSESAILPERKRALVVVQATERSSRPRDLAWAHRAGPKAAKHRRRRCSGSPAGKLLGINLGAWPAGECQTLSRTPKNIREQRCTKPNLDCKP